MSELMKPKEIPSPGGKVARPSAARNQRVGRGMRAVTYKPRKHNRPTLRLDTDCRVGLGLRVSGHRTLSPAFLFSQKSVPKSRFLTAMNQGVIAPGNHWIMDSLRGAPPPGEAMGAPAPEKTDEPKLVRSAIYQRCSTRSLISWVLPWFQYWVPM